MHNVQHYQRNELRVHNSRLNKVQTIKEKACHSGMPPYCSLSLKTCYEIKTPLTFCLASPNGDVIFRYNKKIRVMNIEKVSTQTTYIVELANATVSVVVDDDFETGNVDVIVIDENYRMLSELDSVDGERVIDIKKAVCDVHFGDAL